MTSPVPGLAPDEHFGRRLGKYEILCRISTGGMSEIFLASQQGAAGFRKFVVLKQILPDLRGEHEFLRMFLREAKITAALNHPNLAQVFDLGVDQGELFIAMEYVHGVTLLDVGRALRQQGQRMPIGLACAAARDTANALHYVHAFKNPAYRVDQVVHRDVAEKNVMITFDGGTKLLDFGIAKTLSGLSRTSSGVVKGTPGYIAPEQIRGERPTPLSDIFSLGVVLYHCLTDVLLFKGDTVMEQMNATLTAEIAPPSTVNPEVPKALDEVVLRALERDPRRRTQTAQELSDAIEDACGMAIWRTSQVHGLLQRLFPARAGDWQKILAMVPDDEVSDQTGIVALHKLLSRSENGHADDESWAQIATGTGHHARDPDAAVDTSSLMAAVLEPTMISARAAEGPSAAEESQETVSVQLPEELHGELVADSAEHPPEERTLTGAIVAPATLVLPSEVRTDESSVPGGTPTFVHPTRSRRKRDADGHRRNAQLIGGAIIVAALGVGAFVQFAGASREDPDLEPDPMIREAEVVAAASPNLTERDVEPDHAPPAPTTESDEPVGDAPSRDEDVGKTGAEDAQAGAAASASLIDAPPPKAEAEDEDEEEDEDEAPPSNTRDTVTTTAQRVVREPVRRERTRTAPRKTERQRTAASSNESDERGFLTLSTDSTAVVLFKTQRLGTTPLTKVPLPAGRHVLKLRAANDRLHRMTVVIRAGKATVLKVRLADLKKD